MTLPKLYDISILEQSAILLNRLGEFWIVEQLPVLGGPQLPVVEKMIVDIVAHTAPNMISFWAADSNTS